MKRSFEFDFRFSSWITALCVLSLTVAAFQAAGQSVVQSWEGIRGPQDGVPPDPHGAPGPEGVITTVNLRISYYTKAGAVVWGPVALSGTFFSSNAGAGNSDPAIVFDHASRRYFVIMQENNNSRFWINVAVSRNADPKTAGFADWITYRIDATQNAASNSAGGINYGGDYPGLGVDAQALYVTYNMYGFVPNGTLSGLGADSNGSQLTILNKSQLVNGAAVNVRELALVGQDLKPVTPFGGNSGNLVYLAQVWNQTNVRMTAVSNPLGAATVANQFLIVNDLGPGPANFAPQQGAASTLDPISGRTLGNASLIGTDLWFCATRGPAAGPAVAAYYRLRLNGWPSSGNSVTVAEQGTVGGTSYWNFCPSIGLNQRGDAVMTWTRSSSTSFPTMMVASRIGSDSSFGTPIVIHASAGPNNDDDGSMQSHNRWGDYFSVWPDPNDGSLWAISEWSRAAAPADTGTWSTWLAQIAMPAQNYYVNLNGNPNNGDGSQFLPWTTVTRAHEFIISGTIRIYTGHYNEHITLNKAVTLLNYGGGPVTIGAP